MRVMVATARGLFRDGLVGLIRKEGHEIAGVARDGFEAIELAHRLRPDLVLLDIDAPELRGLEAARAIKERSAETKVVLLTSTSGGCGELIETLRHGVEGYVLKEMPEDQLARTLRDLAELEPVGTQLQTEEVS